MLVNFLATCRKMFWDVHLYVLVRNSRFRVIFGGKAAGARR